MLSWQT